MNYNIVFVCTGNACRSPFAETVLKQMLKEANINNVDVWSCGTLDWGSNPRDAQMVLTAVSASYSSVNLVMMPVTRVLTFFLSAEDSFLVLP